MENRRVMITGLGSIASNGIGKDVFWKALLAGESGIGRISHFDPMEFKSQVAGEVLDFIPETYIEKPKDAKRMDRFTQFAVAATRLALEDTDLDLAKVDSRKVAAYVGSGIGGLKTLEDQYRVLLEEGPSRVNPLLIPKMISNMAAGQVSIQFGIQGPSMCFTTACASAGTAIGEAYEAIIRGDVDVVLAGGAEAAVTPLAVAGFQQLMALSIKRNSDPQKASRPFDAERDGFVIAEGAGIVVLESLENAEKRGARIYAELIGYGATSDAYHITAPGNQGPLRAMQIAIDKAGLLPEDIDYINAHGTSTPINDKEETAAIKELFGEHANKLLISSTKSMTGHLLGATAGVELIATVLTISEGRVPPTINLENSDPECDLNYVPNQFVEREINVAMSNSFGFGGQNAVLVVRKY